MLTIVDVAGRALRIAPYGGWPTPATAANLPLPGNLVQIFDGDQLAELDGFRVTIWPHPSGINGFAMRRGPLSPVVFLTESAVAWSFSRMPLVNPRTWKVAYGTGHRGPLRVSTTDSAVSASSPAPFVIRDVELDTIVATGVQDVARQWVEVAAPAAFYEWPGSEFVVEGGGSAASETFRPLMRYGKAFFVGDFCQTALGSLSPKKLHLGSDDFVTGSPLRITGSSAVNPTPIPVDAVLTIGFGLRGEGAPPDPIVEFDGLAMIVNPVQITLDHAQTFRTSGCAHNLSIPNDQGLDGVVLLMQMLYFDPNDPSEFAATDVYGARIRSGPAGVSALSAGRSASSVQERILDHRRAIREWVDLEPRMTRATRSRAECLVMLRRARGHR